MKFELQSELYFTGEEIMENYAEELENTEAAFVEYDEEMDKVLVELNSLPVIFNFADSIGAELVIKSRGGNPLIILDEGI